MPVFNGLPQVFDIVVNREWEKVRPDASPSLKEQPDTAAEPAQPSQQSTKITYESVRTAEKAKLEDIMDKAMQARRGRFKSARAAKDTNRMWQLISAAVESAWAAYGDLKGPEVQAIRGRGKVTIQSIKQAPQPQESLEKTPESEAWEQTAALYDIQARRLMHVANRTKLLDIGTGGGKGRTDSSLNYVARIHERNDNTMLRVEQGIPSDDSEARQQTLIALEAYNFGATFRHIVVAKASNWYTSAAENCRSKARQAGIKGIGIWGYEWLLLTTIDSAFKRIRLGWCTEKWSFLRTSKLSTRGVATVLAMM